MIPYFDNAATSFPKPPPVAEEITRAVRTMGNPGRGGHAASMDAAACVWAAREAVAALFDAAPENVIFTANCTESINTVLRGLPAFGHVVVSDVEHNAVMRPLALYGIPYSVARTDPQNPRATVAAFAAACRADTRLILCTHASNVTGQILPVREIGALAHRRGIPLAVDAAQSGGLLPLSLKTDPIDFLCLPGHKGLLGPLGTGVLIRSKNLPLTPLFTGGTGSFSLSPLPPDEWPERMESGTQNVPGIAGLGAAVRWLLPRRETVAAHEWALGAALWRGLRAIGGVRVHTPCPAPDQTVPLVLFSVAGMPPEAVAEALSADGIAVRAGLHCAPAAHRKLGTAPLGAVRAAVGVFTDGEDVRFLCKKVALLTKKGLQTDGFMVQ